MNNTLIYLLTQGQLDLPAIIRLIEFGMPKKFLGFSTGYYEPVNLFESVSGETAFHLISRKGKLSDVLPTLFSNAETILAREGIVIDRGAEASAQKVMFKLLMKPNSTGFNSLHFAIYHRDYAALDKITACGFDLNIAEVERRGGEVIGIRHLSPMDFAFSRQDKAVDLVTASIVNGYTSLFEHIYPFLTTEHCRIIPNVVKAVKDVISAGGCVETKFSFNHFARLFNDRWFDVVASLDVEPVVIQKMSRLINLLKHHDDPYWGISENQLKVLVGQETISSLELSVIQALQKYVLDNYARQYLKGGDIDLKLSEIFFRTKGVFDIFDRAELAAVGEAGLLPRELVAKMEDFVYRGNVFQSGGAVSMTSQDIGIMGGAAVADAGVMVEKPVLVPVGGSGILDKDPQVSVSVGLAPKGKKLLPVLPLEKHVAAVISLISDPDGGCKDLIKKHLGYLEISDAMKSYEVLHSVVLVATTMEKYFVDTVLPFAARFLKANPIAYMDFVFGYVQVLEKTDLIATNSFCKMSAFDLACAGDNVEWVKALFEKGFELDLYNSSNFSMYDISLKYNAKEVLKYLFKEQKLVEVDWSKVLPRALHYANVDAVRCYLESDAGVIEVTAERKNPMKTGKYTILNKGLDSLIGLVTLCFTRDLELLDKTLDNVNKLTESLSILITNGKLYFCIDKKDILSKTFHLISSFIRSTGAISDFLEDKEDKEDNKKLKQIEESCNTLKELLTGEYDKLLVSGHDRIEEWARIKQGDFPDNKSDATCKTAFSSMSVFFPRDVRSFHASEDQENVPPISNTRSLSSKFHSKLHNSSTTLSVHEEESSSSVIGDVADD